MLLGRNPLTRRQSLGFTVASLVGLGAVGGVWWYNTREVRIFFFLLSFDAPYPPPRAFGFSLPAVADRDSPSQRPPPLPNVEPLVRSGAKPQTEKTKVAAPSSGPPVAAPKQQTPTTHPPPSSSSTEKTNLRQKFEKLKNFHKKGPEPTAAPPAQNSTSPEPTYSMFEGTRLKRRFGRATADRFLPSSASPLATSPSQQQQLQSPLQLQLQEQQRPQQLVPSQQLANNQTH
ncbi:hypothetical protein QOT17_018135 [Balamuthia mandrillaris]